MNRSGFIDGGVIIALAGLAIVGIITARESVSTRSVTNAEKIEVDNSVYQCREVQRRVIQYYDVETNTYKRLSVPRKECGK